MGITLKPVSYLPLEWRAKAISPSESLADSFKIDELNQASCTIQRFLKRKVAFSKTVNEYRTFCREKHLRERAEKRVFTVERIPEEGYPRIQEILESWRSKIAELQKKIERFSDVELLSNMTYSLLSIEIDLSMKLDPKNKEHCKHEFLIVAKDSSGAVQAMAFLRRPYQPQYAPFESTYFIVNLLTSPDNLRLSFQEGAVRGAATSLIEEAAFLALRNTSSHAVALNSLPRAIPFYQKLGFEKDGEGKKYVLSKLQLFQFLSLYGGVAM